MFNKIEIKKIRLPSNRNIINFKQHGAAVFIVMIVMLLGALLVVWSGRVSLFNERVTGNNADYLLAFEAAQAMVADAELDIMGINSDGSACALPCRKKVLGSLQVPDSMSIYDPDGGNLIILKDAIGTLNVPCIDGLCFDNGNLQAKFWEDSATLDNMKNVAALYGEFTGAVNNAQMGNPRLVVTSDMLTNKQTANAWYWIETLEFNANSQIGNRYAAVGGGIGSTGVNGVIYRITAIAIGRKAGTQAVIQSIVVPKLDPVLNANPSSA